MKNCGYPFHLQISRKEFLNELVRRFPEKPPPMYNRVQSLILQQLQEWWETLCCTSKYKDDLGYIRDMHRLLSFKGYVFPEISLSDAAVLNSTENFQSAAEMEREEREAQEAKLQELIRRGTPADLQEANRLMKIMSGFQQNATDYRAKVAEEVDKLRRKSELLEEMLNNVKEGDSIQSDDVYSEIVSTLKTSQPKLEKMIDEEKDDEEAVIKLLALNDRVHALLQKYALLKKKDYQGASAVKVESSGLPKTTQPNLSLIDFDEEQPASTDGAAAEGSSSGNLLDDLNGLSLGGPSIQLPLSATPSGQSSNFLGGSSPSANAAAPTTPNLLSDLGFGSPSATSTNQATAAVSPKPSTPDYNAFRSLSPGGGSASSAFASPSLGSPSFFSNPSAAPAPAASADDWTFSSAPTQAPPPAAAQPASHTVAALTDTLGLTFTVTRASPTAVRVHAAFSNNGAVPVTNLNLQLAVRRAFTLQMQPQTGTTVAPFAKEAVTQESSVAGAAVGSDLKLRWRVTATVGGSAYERQGVIEDIPSSL